MGRADAGLDDTRKLIDATRGEVEVIQRFVPSFCLHVLVLYAFLPKSLNPVDT